MSWHSSVEAPSVGEMIQAPLILNFRGKEWEPRLQGVIDNHSSDPLTLDLLTALIRHTNPQVIVEAGTYRGWGAFTMAEALRSFDSPGHIWTCDPVDYEVRDILTAMDLASYVTYRQGILEDLLPVVPGEIDLAYIDASDLNDANLRLHHLALVLPRLRAGALVLMDDVATGWEGAAFVKQFANLVLPGHRGVAILQKRI